MEATGKMLEALGTEVDIADFPRLHTQLEYEPGQERGAMETQAQTTEDDNEEEQRSEEEERSREHRMEDMTGNNNNNSESDIAGADTRTWEEDRGG